MPGWVGIKGRPIEFVECDVTLGEGQVNIGEATTATTGSLTLNSGVPGGGFAATIVPGTAMAADKQFILPDSLGDSLIGSPLMLNDGGQLLTLADPGADRLYFWDDSADGAAYPLATARRH